MLKVPTYMCSFEHAKTTRHRFLAKHEVPLFRAHARRNNGSEITVERPPGGLPPECYWASFPDVEFEYSRLADRDGPYGGAQLRDDTYPSFDDFREAVDQELEKVGANRGVNPNAPKEIVADPAIIELVKSVFPELEAGAPADVQAKHATEIKAIAIGLAQVGLLTGDEIAEASMSKLCSAPAVGPALAADLREAAKALRDKNATQDAAGGGGLDLGSLAGRTLE